MTTAAQPFELAPRPGFGQDRKIDLTVQANAYPVTKFTQYGIYHYDMQVTVPSRKPDAPPRELPIEITKELFYTLEKEHRNDILGGFYPVFDGRKNIFSANRLPFKEDRTEFELSLPRDRTRKTRDGKPVPPFQVTISLVAKYDTAEVQRYVEGKVAWSPDVASALMALDVVFNYLPSKEHVGIRNSFFTSTSAQDLSSGLDLWFGMYQSLRPTQKRLLLNVDLSTCAFYRGGNLLRMVAEFMGMRSADNVSVHSLNRRNMASISQYVKGLVVTVSHQQGRTRKYKIKKLWPHTPQDIRFNRLDPAGKEVETSVQGYFKDCYNIRLKYPDAPCVEVQGGPIFPLEVCTIPEGTRYQRKLNENQTAQMIKKTCVRPPERFDRIVRESHKLLDFHNNPYLRDFGIAVDPAFVTTRARQLQLPTLLYQDGRSKGNRQIPVQPFDGAWNMRDRKVNRGATIANLGVLIVDSIRNSQYSQRQTGEFLENMRRMVGNMGMRITVTQRPNLFSTDNVLNIEDSLRAIQKQLNVGPNQSSSIIMVVLGRDYTSSAVYGEIKRVSDTVLSIPTQCMRLANLKKGPQYIANVLLKVNVKLGGANGLLRNSTLEALDRRAPAMVVGADISHPGPGNDEQPSIAAVVGALDAKLSRYTSCVTYQAPRTEIISELESTMVKLLQTYSTVNGKYPQQIIFYRDGVSESQFSQVCTGEVDAIRRACARIPGRAGYKPRITFVTCQKRHHFRFNAVEARMRDRKSQNAPPGTVVDKDVTHPSGFDFFLQSQGGLQGTCRPVHYTVLVDENKFSADQMQNLTNEMCYLFPRCTRSVSLCTPAYFAHVLAGRARFHRNDKGLLDDGASVTSGGPAAAPADEAGGIRYDADFRKVDSNFENTLYYM
ncbi:hypothetical protein IWQ62_001650 [Dispira parvispora]|uniref:Uncharacterized protein n=1 Tax=Dispira parvispora TaxID=1520584 RepID=A0A9W8AUI5_9FUNG|nr:hypothetical protein IWQ62_001650 [Dispira parvispora]